MYAIFPINSLARAYKPIIPIQSKPATREQEIDTLYKHMEDLERQLKDVKRKLEELK